MTKSVSKYISFSGQGSFAVYDPNLMGNWRTSSVFSYNSITSLSLQFFDPYYRYWMTAINNGIGITARDYYQTNNSSVTTGNGTSLYANNQNGLLTWTYQAGNYTTRRYSDSRTEDSYGNISLTHNEYYWCHDGYYNMSTSYHGSSTFVGNTRTSSTQTTGTSYLTRSSTYSTVYYTRSSTYSTVYHTRSSTSGYSGVSSSSSETSGWQ